MKPKWVSLSNSSDLFLYSALQTDSQVNLIVLIRKNDIIRQYLYCGFDSGDVQKGNLIVYSESRSVEYEAANIQCTLPLDSKYQIRKVFLFHPPTQSYTKYIKIETSELVNNDSVVLCVQPLSGTYYTSVDVLQFIAYYSIHGASKFYFYNQSITDEISRLLLKMNKVVEILPWNILELLPNHQYGVTFWHYAQKAQIHDCLLRNQASVIINVDIDEYIVPLKAEDLKTYLIKQKKEDQTNLIIGSVLFPKRLNIDIGQNQLKLFHHFYRTQLPWWHRSKVIALQPKFIKHQDIHIVMQHEPARMSTLVSADTLLIYHYREWGVLNDNMINDTLMLKFKEKIVKFSHEYNRNIRQDFPRFIGFFLRL
ncbi:unnamed protein product [Didymodactylos carnosus]|uniref:Glycosyltransferase family 92 protein n=1 Tax=Didymodactylos carnosus TaxID=1234261 RepID=A0A813S4G5_9BILA|nr:unnamed protein product [Didymodactylos carnosus]CAF3574181.1 unnamed protein product [Didymodactylos carnosus]